MTKKRKTVMVQGADGIFNIMSSEDAKAQEKAQEKTKWLDEGRELGTRANTSAWEIGRWLVRGEELIGDEKPTSKRALRAYYRVQREKWEALISEASKATNLAESSLKKYAQVVRRGVKVEGLSFAQHIEVMRAHYFDHEKNRRFDSNAATAILMLAKDNNWTVAQTRAEVSRQFPTPNIAQDALYKIKRILNAVSDDQKQALIEALEAELASMKAAPTQPELLDVFGNELPY
ncbi:MAG: hypothetical protein WBQ43_02710 [Terriglobales bacterium]